MLTEEKVKDMCAGIENFPRKCANGRGYRKTKEPTKSPENETIYEKSKP
jgi:hypothetical protein